MIAGLSAGTRKYCVFGQLGLVFIWSCFVFCLLFLLFYVISAPVLAEAAVIAVWFAYIYAVMLNLQLLNI